jgi:hypothetical protein
VWGRDEFDSMIAGAVHFYGRNMKNKQYLSDLSEQIGSHEVQSTTRSSGQGQSSRSTSRSWQERPILPINELASLSKHRAIVVFRKKQTSPFNEGLRHFNGSLRRECCSSREDRSCKVAIGAAWSRFAGSPSIQRHRSSICSGPGSSAGLDGSWLKGKPSGLPVSSQAGSLNPRLSLNINASHVADRSTLTSAIKKFSFPTPELGRASARCT